MKVLNETEKAVRYFLPSAFKKSPPPSLAGRIIKLLVAPIGVVFPAILAFFFVCLLAILILAAGQCLVWLGSIVTELDKIPMALLHPWPPTLFLVKVALWFVVFIYATVLSYMASRDDS